MAIESLFGITPQDIQSQRNAEAQRQAMALAQMKPAQQAQYAAYMAGNQLGTALGGMMGAEDPELKKASMVNNMLKETDMNDLNSVRKLVNQLNSVGASREAMSLIPRIDKLSEAEADRQTKLDIAESKKGDLIAELVKSGKYKPASIAKFAKTRDASDLETTDGKRKTSWQTVDGQRKLMDDETGEVVAVAGAAGKTLEESLGAGIGKMGELLGGVLAKKQAEGAGSASGKITGEDAASIQRLFDAEAAAAVAIKKLDDGIFAGGYGPAQELLAKYKVAGSAQRLKNTQEFRAEVGNLVIPRLKDIGGNDSDNEMKYLREISGGQTDIEPDVLKNILTNYVKRLKERRQRIEVNQANVGVGKPPETGPMTPVVRKSWNDLK